MKNWSVPKRYPVSFKANGCILVGWDISGSNVWWKSLIVGTIECLHDSFMLERRRKALLRGRGREMEEERLSKVEKYRQAIHGGIWMGRETNTNMILWRAWNLSLSNRSMFGQKNRKIALQVQVIFDKCLNTYGNNCGNNAHFNTIKKHLKGASTV